MKKKILLGIAILFVAFIGYILYALFLASPVSPPATVSFNQNGLEITIDYSQPSKKDRLIFGEESDGALQPYGKYWRLGANAATEISFNQDVIFGGEAVEAGTYRMYAIPGADTFTVRLNSETDVFFGIAEPDYSLDVVSVEVPTEKLTSSVETFTIDFSDTDQGIAIHFKWDKVLFTVPVSVK